MVTYTEYLTEAAKLDKPKFIKWMKNWMESQDGDWYTEISKDDKNVLELKNSSTDGQRGFLVFMALNTKTAAIKMGVDKTSTKYKWATTLFSNMKVDYWNDNGKLDDKGLKSVLKRAGITDIEDSNSGVDFKTADGQWFTIFVNGKIEKKRAKKNIEARIKKDIQESWKEEVPGLKWYFTNTYK